jgi:hypothetical protein
MSRAETAVRIHAAVGEGCPALLVMVDGVYERVRRDCAALLGALPALRDQQSAERGGDQGGERTAEFTGSSGLRV